MSTTPPIKRDSNWTITKLETAYDTLCKQYEELKKRNDTTLRLCENKQKELDGASATNKSLYDEHKAYLRNLHGDLSGIMQQMENMNENTDGGDSSAQGVGHEDGQGTT